MKSTNKSFVFLLFILILLTNLSCKKSVNDLPARTKIDVISLSFGNAKTTGNFTIQNTGQQILSYAITEDIPWLELDKTNGKIAGKSFEPINATVNRDGLSQNRYEGTVRISTNDKTTILTAYLTVDMFLVTVVNPVFTTIKIDVDSSKFKTAENNYSRLIGAGDSTQFSYFEKPDLFIYYAQTSGIYTDSTLLGLKMEWDDILIVGQTAIPRIFLDVPKEYFFLSFINPLQNLYPLYVNAGSSFEKLENIVISQSSEPMPVGYYQALENTVVRAFVYGSSLSVTWSQGVQFNFPFTKNQDITLENYLNDSTGKSSPVRHYQLLPPREIFDKHYGDVIEVMGSCKQ